MTSEKAATASSYRRAVYSARPSREWLGGGERVKHTGAAGGRNARIKVPHEGCKSAAESQNLRIARRERQGPLVLVTRLREVEGSVFRNCRQCGVPLGQVRCEREHLARIRLRLVKAFTRRSWRLGLASDNGKGDRSAGERERIVRIEANRFCICGDRGGEVFGVVARAKRLGPAQIRIEGRRVTRPAELDFCRDVAEECDFEGACHRGRNLRLKFQHIP